MENRAVAIRRESAGTASSSAGPRQKKRRHPRSNIINRTGNIGNSEMFTWPEEGRDFENVFANNRRAVQNDIITNDIIVDRLHVLP